MRLVHADMGLALDIMEDAVPLLCVESPPMMAQIISEIKEQILGAEGSFILSEDKQYVFSKSVEIIVDPWEVDFCSKKIKTGIFQIVKECVDENLYEEYVEIRGNLLSFAEKVIEEVPYPLSYNSEMDLPFLAKSIDFSIKSDAQSLLEKLVEYLKLSSSMCGTKLFVLVNIRCFLSQADVELLLQEVILNKIPVIMIEARVPETVDKREKIVIIDRQGCIITL